MKKKEEEEKRVGVNWEGYKGGGTDEIESWRFPAGFTASERVDVHRWIFILKLQYVFKLM